ncbi:MAG: M23 family metallopeptidase [Bacteroidales bacterium]|nr:M23 family metallopeptidase [Bacteroidales bacterium]
MSPQTVKIIVAVFSMRHELKYIFWTIIVICLLPVFAVIILTQNGIDLVSDVLVTGNTQTSQVEIRDPATGEIVDHVDQTSMWPVSGPVSLEFGVPHLPIQLFHTGIDIATTDHQVGDPVGAFMAGTVTYAGETSYGYGKHVIVNHGHHVSSLYGHFDSIIVQEGQEVEVGTVLGLRGNTGWSTGPHLHFEIRVFGIPVNPRIFLTGNP